ncbi:hypothetical protein KW796_00735 [Candidatus Parcubacteria bacterium]|nr:hypothetical protein [Candidatus Parcubacteria bacterium]
MLSELWYYLNWGISEELRRGEFPLICWWLAVALITLIIGWGMIREAKMIFERWYVSNTYRGPMFDLTVLRKVTPDGVRCYSRCLCGKVISSSATACEDCSRSGSVNL